MIPEQHDDDFDAATVQGLPDELREIPDEDDQFCGQSEEDLDDDEAFEPFDLAA